MKFSIYQSSRQGGRRYNQDRLAYSYSKEALLMVVADGMGGHYQGEIAAQITVQLLAERFQQEARPVLRDPFHFLLTTMRDAHEGIAQYAYAHNLLESPRTTCVAAIVQRNFIYWAHVGDSRLYLLRGGKVVARTHDHSKVQQLFEQGKISAEEVQTHPERNKIYNCLGGMVAPEIELSRRVALEKGDTLLLCTDGVWAVLPEDEIGTILKNAPIVESIPELLDHAEFRGGRDGDNLSAIGMVWGGDDKPQAVSTNGMALDTFTTKLESDEDLPESASALSEDEIEKAINEIQTAIQKFAVKPVE